MKVYLIRTIDYLLGIPGCFLLSLWEKLAGLFRSRKKEEGDPKRILIIKPFELGSIILSFPLIEKIKQLHPDAKIYFLTSDRNKDIFLSFDIIPKQRVITFNEDSVFTISKSLILALHQIRKLNIDISIDLEFFSRASIILAYFSKAKKRIGFDRFSFEGLYRGNLLTHKVQYNPHLHISQLFYSFHNILKLDKKTTPTSDLSLKNLTLTLPKFQPTEKQTQKISLKLKRMKVEPKDSIYLINPGEGLLPLREWPIENFINVIQTITNKENTKVILVGTLKCKEKAATIMEAINHPDVMDMTSQTTLEELLTLISTSTCLLSNDSGMAHLGALTETKQIVLFGPEHPHVFAPLGNNIHVLHTKSACSPCLSVYNHRRSNCKDNLCLKSIPPEEVTQIILD